MSYTQKITDGTLLFDVSGATGLDGAATTTTLAVALTTTTGTSVQLTSGSGVATGRVINVGTENMRVVDDSAAPVYVVERGYNGTTAATHLISATVNVPGYLTVNLLSILSAPNVQLFIHKTDISINYIRVVTPNTYPGGGTEMELTDNTANGTLHLKFPGLGNVLLVLAAGGALVGPAGVPGPPGPSPTPPGAFTIGTVTAEWVVILAS